MENPIFLIEAPSLRETAALSNLMEDEFRKSTRIIQRIRYLLDQMFWAVKSGLAALSMRHLPTLMRHSGEQRVLCV